MTIHGVSVCSKVFVPEAAPRLLVEELEEVDGGSEVGQLQRQGEPPLPQRRVPAARVVAPGVHKGELVGPASDGVVVVVFVGDGLDEGLEARDLRGGCRAALVGNGAGA